MIHLEVGEPDFATPAHVIEAAHRAAAEGFTKYTPNAGLTELRAAVAERYGPRLGRDLTVENVVVAPGAVAAIAATLFAVLDPGDEILVPDPGWPNYRSAVTLAGATARPYPLRQDLGFEPDLAELPRLIGPRTKAILVNSPSNPTGRVLPRHVIEGLVEIANRHDLLLVSDEVYEEFTYDAEHFSPATVDDDGRVVVISGVSKTYAMTGWRIGYTLAPTGLASTIAKLQEGLFSCASAVSQKAAEAALLGPQSCVADMLDVYRRRRDLVVDMLGKAGLLAVEPNGSFYALVDVTRRSHDSQRLAEDLISAKRVATAPGATFGELGEGRVRISFATNTDALHTGLDRLREHLS